MPYLLHAVPPVVVAVWIPAYLLVPRTTARRASVDSIIIYYLLPPFVRFQMLSTAVCDAVSLKRLPGYCLLKELDVAGCRRRDRIARIG